MSKNIQYTNSITLASILEKQRREVEEGIPNPHHFKKNNSNIQSEYKNILPDYIQNNLKHNLRYYQVDSFLNMLYLENTLPKFYLGDLYDSYQDNNFLFHLPTGAGKTTIMAGNILLSVANGYKHFIYFTNSVGLVEQTKDSLLYNNGSQSCEFKKEYLKINNKTYSIKEVDKFTDTDNEIQIMFCTSNKIHSMMTEVKENYQGINELKKFDIIFLADEAHHFQAQTKKNVKEFDKNWENSIQQLLNINTENKLYEFTGTAELDNKLILEKYKSKIIYDYSFAQFNRDGFCKEIKLIQIDKIEDRIMFAIINNHIRSVFFKELNSSNISKIFFKSTGTIEKFRKEQQYVFNTINNFNEEALNKLISKTKDILSYSINNFIDEYYNGNKEKLISEIKSLFVKENSVSIHSKDSKSDKEYNMNILKTLDYENKEIRIVFAIDMLNEGWNVLSLFDIIKLDEISNKKNGSVSERQLIGRGTRICPFEYRNIISNKRIFDKDPTNKYKMLEECYFYSANDNKYISGLQKELIEIGYTVSKGGEKNYKSINFNSNMSDFVKSILEESYICVNSKKDLGNKKLFEILNKDMIDISYSKNFDSVSYLNINVEQQQEVEDIYVNSYSLSDFLFNGSKILKIKDKEINLKQKEVKNIIKILKNKQFLINTNYFILYKTFMNNEFLKFDYFKEYLNKVKENNNTNKLNIFQKFLINLLFVSDKIYVKTDKDLIDLTYKEKEELSKGILESIHNFIEMNKIKYIGTDFNKDNKKYFKDIFKPYNVSVNKELTQTNKNYYLYDYLSFDSDSLEPAFYKNLDNYIIQYDLKNIGVFRNNQQAIKLYLPNGKGFVVDTVLIYKEKDEDKLKIMLIEQKGEHLIKHDSDKESFLINDGKPLYEDSNICMIGYRFFTEKNKISYFNNLFNLN
jgi:type III restriction enzyme